MISLLFKFFGDSTPLRQEAEKAKKDMGKAGGEIGKEFASQIKGAIMGAIGVGAIASELKAKLAEIDKAAGAAAGTGAGIRETLALQRASEATGMKPDEILDMARRNPKEFGSFIQRFEPGLGETDLRNISRGKEAASGLWDMFTDALLSKGAQAVGRITGAIDVARGGIAGDRAAIGRGLVGMATGVTPEIMAPSPTERFMVAARATAASDAAFNASVDETNRLIEEVRKVREAIERN